MTDEELSKPTIAITIKSNDAAQVWYDYDQDHLFIRHVIHEGEFAAFHQAEYDQDFAPAMEFNRFFFIGVL